MIVTLTTDFGEKDPFVGIMKGVIAGINPQASVIDLSHGVAAQDIMQAALILRHSVNFFPQGSIHVAVVDPGVGSARRPILIEGTEAYFIGPDNGVLSLALGNKKPVKVIHLSNAAFHRRPTSATFHGRDIFAPIAAHLSRGANAAEFGETIEDFIRIAWPVVSASPVGLRGEIIYIDGFGNLFTNVTALDLERLPHNRLAVGIGEAVIHGLSASYDAAGQDNSVAVINSWGLLEIAVYQGNAQQRWRARIGDLIEVGVQ